MTSVCALVPAVPLGTEIAVVSFLAAAAIAVALWFLRVPNTLKPVAVYGHLTFLFLPLVLFSTNAACGSMALSCYGDTLSLMAMSLPVTLLLSAIAGAFLVPNLYFLSHRRLENAAVRQLTRRWSRRLAVPEPRLYVINRARPESFSLRSLASGIFLSAGLLETFSRRELEAVIIHEIAHLRRASSHLKLSSALFRLSPFSLIRGFHSQLDGEEAAADRCVIELQGTGRHLLSAKRTIEAWDASSRRLRS